MSVFIYTCIWLPLTWLQLMENQFTLSEEANLQPSQCKSPKNLTMFTPEHPPLAAKPRVYDSWPGGNEPLICTGPFFLRWGCSSCGSRNTSFLMIIWVISIFVQEKKTWFLVSRCSRARIHPPKLELRACSLVRAKLRGITAAPQILPGPGTFIAWK